MKFILISVILFLGMYAFAVQDELEAQLNSSTCAITDANGQPIKDQCDGRPALKSDFNSKSELKNQTSSSLQQQEDPDLDIE